MKNMKKVLAVTAAVAMTAAMMPTAVFADDAETFKIGVIGPMTGDNAQYGLGVYHAAQVAAEEINANGGFNGYNVEILDAGDDQADPEKAVNAYNDLREDVIAMHHYSAREESRPATIESANTRERDHHQAYFPVNPYEFVPRGLVRKEYPGSYNGRIIKWVYPLQNTPIFEWNEDFENGAHYHVLKIEWAGKHDGTHYMPDTPVPEPWNSIYFGDYG